MLMRSVCTFFCGVFIDELLVGEMAKRLGDEERKDAREEKWEFDLDLDLGVDSPLTGEYHKVYIFGR